MEKTINYTENKDCSFLGRNGVFIQSGINVWKGNAGTIFIEPVTSKGVAGRCRMEIPDENLGELIHALLTFKNTR